MLVFVYGTLKRGFGNYKRLLGGRSEYIGKAHIKGRMFSVNMAFPAYIEEGENMIEGELFVIDEGLLGGLDMLEGYVEDNEEISMYIRRERKVVTEYGAVLKTWVYIWNRDYSTFEEVKDGVWKKYNFI